jgi:phenylalanyl-tRNA synthetase beta chain
LAKEIGVEDVRLVVAELDLSKILEITADVVKPVITVDHFLPVEQDFAIVVSKDVPSSQVSDALRKNAGPLLTDMVLFDVFEGEQVGTENKSLAYRLTFTAPDRALTDAELEKTRKKIEKGLKALVGGTLRA